jgi:hypothetical protein
MKNIAIPYHKRTAVIEKVRLGTNVAIPLLILSFINQPTPILVSLLYSYMKRLKIKAFPSEKGYNKKK